jgi:magnesium transporter
MISKRQHKNLTWIDLNRPTHEEVESLVKEYNIHPIVGEALLEPTLHPKVEEYNNLLYLVMHFPTMSNSRFGSDQQEIDFVLGKDFLITAHYDLTDPLHNFAKQFEVNSIIDTSTMGQNPGLLFYHIMKNLYKDMRVELQTLRSHTKKVEEITFSGNNGQIVEDLSEISHKILDFREATRFHKSLLQSFGTTAPKLYGTELSAYTESLTSEYYKLWEILENLRETIIELKKTNDSLLAYKTNETIRFLTLFTFMALPLQIIPDIFTTDVFVHGVYSSHTIHFTALAVSLMMFFYFRFKKWL